MAFFGLCTVPVVRFFETLNIGLSITLLYAAIIFVPTLSAFSIFNRKRGKTNLIAQVANFVIIAFFSFSFAELVNMQQLDIALIITTLIIVLPAILNIFTLRKLRGSYVM
jgi:hypothetical protein